MCGIAGEWDWGGEARSFDDLTAMIDAIAHRGPEGQSCWLSKDGKLALAHAQLSFFKGAEKQPVSNDQGTIFAVCNGEIDNHRELARWLADRGRPVLQSTDVAVIPGLYLELGEAFASRLVGAFAIAVWDPRNQRLTLVRDRAGGAVLHEI